MADKFKPQTAHAQPQNVPAKPTEIRRNAPPSQNAPLTFVQAVKASQKQSGNGSWCFEAKNDPSAPISLHSTTARGTHIEGINDNAICHSSATLAALGVTLLRASDDLHEDKIGYALHKLLHQILQLVSCTIKNADDFDVLTRFYLFKDVIAIAVLAKIPNVEKLVTKLVLVCGLIVSCSSILNEKWRYNDLAITASLLNHLIAHGLMTLTGDQARSAKDWVGMLNGGVQVMKQNYGHYRTRLRSQED